MLFPCLFGESVTQRRSDSGDVSSTPPPESLKNERYGDSGSHVLGTEVVDAGWKLLFAGWASPPVSGSSMLAKKSAGTANLR